MIKLFDRVKVNIPTTGTGDIEFGAAASTAFLTPTEAGVLDGDEVRYVIVDGLDFEEGTGLVKDTVATMERTVVKSKISGTVGATPINLSGTATLALTASAADILTRGEGLFAESNLSDLADTDEALENLGGTTVGAAVFKAADAAAARVAIGVTDNHVNEALDRIYLSKLLGEPRRVVDAWGTGLKAATDVGRGIDAGASSNVDATNAVTGGYVAPTMSAGSAIADGAGTAFGNMTSNGGLSAAFSGSDSKIATASSRTGLDNSSGYIGKNFGGSPQAVHSVTVYATSDLGFDGTAVATTITITLYGKQSAPASGTDGTILGTTGGFTDAVGISKTIASNDSSTKWNYVWIYIATTEAYSPSVGCSRLYFLQPAYANMTLETTPQATDGSVGNARAVIEFNNVDEPTLDADLAISLTCDGGANWELAPLVAVTSHGQGGRSVAETGDIACPTGASFAARIETFGKNVPIYGVSVSVH